MNTLPYQPEIAARMLAGGDANDTIRPDARFIQTANGCWIAWHDPDTPAAVLPPNTPAGEPCFWVEGAEDLAELVHMAENGDFDHLDDADDGTEPTPHTCTYGCAHAHD